MKEIKLTEREGEIILKRLGGHTDWLEERINFYIEGNKSAMVSDFRYELAEVQTIKNKTRDTFGMIKKC